ncbi:hypothetical protein M2326_002131 [Flavobacterium sp. 7A]|nr:hypothetical protein [Flavobacterium sp. 7A]
MGFDALVFCIFGTWYFNIIDSRRKKRLKGLSTTQYIILFILVIFIIDFLVHFYKAFIKN